MFLHAVEPHAEPLGNAVAREIAGGAADFDPAHAEFFERDAAELLHGRRDDAPVLELLAEPVPDFDASASGVGRFESDESGEKAAGAEGVDRIGGIAERSGDESPAVLLASGKRHERQPLPEVAALGIDGAEDVAGVVGPQGPEGKAIEKRNRHVAKIVKRTKTAKFSGSIYKVRPGAEGGGGRPDDALCSAR